MSNNEQEQLNICNDCNREHPIGESRETADGRIICNDCFRENYFRCERCERIYRNDSGGEGAYCEECSLEIEREEEREREEGIISPNNTLFVNKKSQYRNLPIGVEIEAELKDDYDYDNVLDELDGSGYGICEDGSLNRGVEVQVPASNGRRTKDLVIKACRILEKYSYIQDTCGLHVHIGYPSGLSAVKNALTMSYVAEPVFFGVIPASRQNNHYCQAIRSHFNLNDILEAKAKDIDELVYSTQYGRSISKNRMNLLKQEKYNNCRYYGVNIHSFFYRKTIEFRYHSGTLDPVKILNWAELLKKILVYAKFNFNKDRVLEIERSENFDDRSKKLFETIGLSKKLRNYFLNRHLKFNPLRK